MWNMIFDQYANKSTDYYEIGFLLLGGFDLFWPHFFLETSQA